MELLDAVVKLDANGCEIWAGDQFQTVDQANAAATAGLRPEQVKIHTLLAGGSFDAPGQLAAWGLILLSCIPRRNPTLVRIGDRCELASTGHGDVRTEVQ